MGNEQSHLAGIEIEEKSVEVSDFWSHHSATVDNFENITNLTVLIGEIFVDGPLWKSQTPLEKCSKNLMIYRHPCIVKYISSWQQSSKYYLALEEVKPLSHALASQNNLQICIGLHSILKALCFLHEKALVSHNNICTASVYVTKDGNWKLGSTEYLCRFSDLTSEFLKKSRMNRYDKAVDPNEDKHLKGSSRKDFIDVYAYGVLVCEVLKSKTDDDIPALSTFRDLCKNNLQHVSILERPALNNLLNHEFFNHDFIVIHSFLLELPLKSDDEKTTFFQNLAERLKAFQETAVASQLGNLLLSRMVLLNKTAQDELLPYILCPKEGSDDDSGRLLSEDTFKEHLTPKLLEIFSVRDAQIRLLLLKYFNQFVTTFSKDELQSKILPELLVGVKDTNDLLVAVTLRTLADLVPILGAATVIGGKRGKLFNDGRPIVHAGRRPRKNSRMRIDSTVSLNVEPHITNPIIQTNQVIMDLPERPRPDGEEEETAEEAEQSVEEDLDNWETDWDINESNSGQAPRENLELPSVNSSSVDSVTAIMDRNLDNTESNEISALSTPALNESSLNLSNHINNNNLNNDNTVRKKSLPDISELDIKNQAGSGQNDEFDFFQGMEPVIESSSKYLISEEAKLKQNIESKLSFIVDDHTNEDGWVDEEWD